LLRISLVAQFQNKVEK